MKRWLFCPYPLFLLLFVSVASLDAQLEPLADKLQFEPIPYNNLLLSLPQSNIQSLHEDRHGLIWVAALYDVFYFDGNHTENFTRWLRNECGFEIAEKEFHAIMTDSLDNVWMAGQAGLYVYNLTTRIFKHINFRYPYGRGIKATERISNLSLIDDVLYACTFGGFFAVDIHTKKVLFPVVTVGVPPDNQDDYNMVKAVYPIPGDSIYWGSCNNGYFRFNLKKDTLDIFQAYFTSINEWWYGKTDHYFYQGFFRGDTIIAPSYGHGMIHFDTVSKSYQQHLAYPEDTLSKFSSGRFERIKSYLPYDNEHIIINEQAEGIGIYNLADHSFTYRHPKTNANFERHVGTGMIYDRFGRIWAQRVRSRRPVNNITDSIANNLFIHSVSNADTTYRQVSLLNIDTLYFSWEHKDLTINFGIVNALYPDEIKYKYQITEEHEAWHPISNNTELHISNFPTGVHRVRLRALKDGSLLDEAEALIVKPLPFYRSRWFFVCCLLGVIAATSLITGRIVLLYRRNKLKEVEAHNHLLELEAKALKSQMNPHFIFNSLNAIKRLINQRYNEKADYYLSLFARFVRKVLNYSDEKMIGFDEEISICQSYLEMEKLRFEDSFHYTIEIEPDLDLSFVKVPPLILQPFLENAIWHGLSHKEGERLLKVILKKKNDQLLCVIEDNGIGRQQAKEYKTGSQNSHKSYGIQLIMDRLKVSREMYKVNYEVEIIDKEIEDKAAGTRVEFRIDL